VEAERLRRRGILTWLDWRGVAAALLEISIRERRSKREHNYDFPFYSAAVMGLVLNSDL
jgi:hypothetical protein